MGTVPGFSDCFGFVGKARSFGALRGGSVALRRGGLQGVRPALRGLSEGDVEFGEERQLPVVAGRRWPPPILVVAPDPVVAEAADRVAERVQEVDRGFGGLAADGFGAVDAHVDLQGHGRSSSRACWTWVSSTVRALTRAAADRA